MDCDVYADRKALVPHRNGSLTETGRVRLARCVVEDGWPLRRAAERFQVSPTTAQRWATRYRQFGEAGTTDLSYVGAHSSRTASASQRAPFSRCCRPDGSR